MSKSEDAKEEVSIDATVLMFRKSPGIAIILSLMISGAGQMYVGKVVRGVKILFSIIALFISPPIVLALIAIISESNRVPEFIWLLAIGSFMIYIPAFILHIWQIIDAYRQANRYNEGLIRLKRKPENGEY